MGTQFKGEMGELEELRELKDDIERREKAQAVIVENQAKRLEQVRPRWFSCSHPECTFPSLCSGTASAIAATGLTLISSSVLNIHHAGCAVDVKNKHFVKGLCALGR